MRCNKTPNSLFHDAASGNFESLQLYLRPTQDHEAQHGERLLHHCVYYHSETAPWVTFIHGAGGSSSIWFRQIRDFKMHFNVLLIDLRGHGKSQKPVFQALKRYTFDVIGDDIIHVLDHVGIRQSHFVGISLGTIIIRDIAERHSDRVTSMVLGGAVMKLDFRGQFLMKLGVLLQSVIPYLILYKFFAYIILPRKKHRESRSLFVQEARKLYQKEFRRWLGLASQVNALLYQFRSRGTLHPTLYIMGSEDHMFLPSIERVSRSEALASLQVIEACGHVVNVESPAVFNSLAIRFIRNSHGAIN